MSEGKPTDDLEEAMRLLLEQELTTGLGSPKPATSLPLLETREDDSLENDVLRLAALALHMAEDQLDPNENLANFGVDSIAITEIMASISRFFGISVAPTTFFEARHLNDLARILHERHAKAIDAHYAKNVKMPTETHIKNGGDETKAWLSRHRATRRPRQAPAAVRKAVAAEGKETTTPIAIIAMEGMFPQSPDLDSFEAHLRQGDDCIEEVPANRWDWRAVYGDPRKGDLTQVKTGGFVPGHDLFDAAFFHIAPREAEMLDPQHRLFMQCVWSLIEKSGHAPGSLKGKRVGMFLGINLLDYVNMANRLGQMDAQQLTGLGHAFCPNRLSFLLDIHGPSQVIDTACSSSLVALHRAAMSIRFEGCDMAIAGGANLQLSPDQHILFSKVGMLAQDGRCKTFSRHADGYARADGVGAVLLKRLDKAEQDGDPILGVILSSAEHHGGAATSLTAPNPQSQARLIADAHRQAGIDPRSVTLIECHGTGTKLGDPAEVEGLKLAFQELYRERGLPMPEFPNCGLGSVKSNIGHTETAAGIAGLIKVLLAMQSGTLYRSLHCEEPNPLIDLGNSPFYLLDQARPWKRPQIEGIESPRRAGISSFGAGGTNVHVVVEEYRSARDAIPAPGRRPQIVPLSAHAPESLRLTLAALRPLVESLDLDDLAFTLQTGRDAMRHRVAFVVQDTTDLKLQIDSFLQGNATAVASGVVAKGASKAVVAADADVDGMAKAWVVGAGLDWSALHGGSARRRLVLPGTSFLRKRFWLAEKPVADAPPVGFHLRQTGLDRWQIDLMGDEFFLADHRLQGQPILPGVAYLELAQAVARQAGLAANALRNVVWIQPLAVSGPVQIELTLIRKDEGGSRLVEIASRSGPDGSKRVHAQIRLADTSCGPAPTMDLSTLESAHDQVFTAEQIYALFDGMGLNYGPSHRAITRLATGLDAKGRPQVLARLSLPACVADTRANFTLHPSLMDGAFQAGIGIALGVGGRAPAGAALPFALDAVDLLGVCTGDMWVHVRQAETETLRNVQTLDLDVMDDRGAAVVSLRGFATRLPKAEGLNEVMAFVPAWREADVAAMTAKSQPGTILLAGGSEENAALSKLLPDWNCRAIDLDPIVSLDAKFAVLAQEVLAILKSADPARPMRIVLRDEPDAEALAGIVGMLRSATLERPGPGGQVVIVPENLPTAELAKLLISDLPGNAVLRWQNGQIQQEAWQSVALPPASRPWHNGKTYLITGGLGGLGRLITQDILATAPQATVVLASRSQPSAAEHAWMKGLAGIVRHVSTDLADSDTTAALIEDIRNKHGHLDGIIHAAGVIQDGPLSGKTAQQLSSTLASKVAGTVNLDRAVGAAPLDFFILFSSLSASFGNPGQVDYAAANGFLDGFAGLREARRRRGDCHGRTISIAWPLWRDGGMAMNDDAQTLMTRTTGLIALESKEGLDALARAVAGEAARLLITVGDQEKIRKRIPGQNSQLRPAAKPAIATAMLQDKLLAALATGAARQLKVAVADLEPDVELTEYGFDSIGFTQFANALNDEFDLELTPTVFFEQRSLTALATYLAESQGDALARRLGIGASQGEPETAPPLLLPAARTVAVTRPQPESQGDAVAIIGMSCHFPKARNIQEFWQNLEQGRDCITEIPPERWNWRDYWGDPLTEPGRCDVRWGGFIEGADEFDAAFFGLSAPEARMMDPQQRLLLTQAWRVIEHAGYAPRHLSGSTTGVFVGTADTGYGRLLADVGSTIEGYSMTGLAPSLGPNRISYHFNFHGPSQAIETACSSALVAIHRAAEAIRHGQCDTAIAGGINLLLMPDSFVGFAKAGMLAKDGRCKPFAAKADGYARGEGVGLVFLKRLSDAERDGDRILAVVRASGENHGGHASSLTAPNPKAQADLLRGVYRKSGFDPRTVGYIEAHGTGTPLGDPIEVEALTAAFADLNRQAESDYGPALPMDCAIGSVKSNIGHLELAAGIAGLIKALLQIKHGALVRSLYCDELNPYLKLKNGPFHVARESAAWIRRQDGQGHDLPRRAGVSSFGFGGANAHVVVEEYLTAPKELSVPPAQPELFVLSGHSPEALTQWAQRLHDFMAGNESASLSEIAFTLQTARDAMEHRLAFTALSVNQAVMRLRSFLDGQQDGGLHQGRVKPNRAAMAVLESDLEFKLAASGLVGRGNAEGLLELWVRGLTVDWSEIRGQTKPGRVELPAYPLAATRYWVRREGVVPPRVLPAASAQITMPESGEAPVTAASSEWLSIPAALQALTAIAAEVLEVDPQILDADTELGEFGFDSITMTGFAAKVNAGLNLTLTPADFFEFATLARLAQHIAGTVVAAPTKSPVASHVHQDDAVLIKKTYHPPAQQDDPIAIVGLSCRFPQSPDADSFWDNLLEGRDCISRIPADRWDWKAFDGDPKTDQGKTNIHWGGFIDGVFEFDPLFFGISPREAKLMDPQQRLAMQHVWKAIEDSGHSPRSLSGRKVGVFIGTSSSGYRDIIGDDTGAEGYVATGAVPSVGPNRISYFLNWHGPSEPVETACSSSLVALHRAVLSMRAGDCDMAVVGGVNTIVTPEAHINFAKAGMLSPDGRCKTFSALANGYGRGEGVGMVVLKRLSEAERDRDPIIALVKSSAVSHGGRANSLTAPNTQAQADLLREAQAKAGVDSTTIGYVEAHGTGTALGDPVEINALKAVFGTLGFPEENKERGFGCAIGSVKSNIGHLELAAGIAGVIKVLLQMQRRTLAPSIHCDEINPYIDLQNSPLRIVRNSQPWRPVMDEAGTPLPLRAGVSSFGFGGVNAHVILEAYQPPAQHPVAQSGPVVIVLSARDAERLKEQARNLQAFLDGGRLAESELADLAFTLQLGRDAMRHRLAIPASSLAELRNRLGAFLNDDTTGMFVGKLEAGQKAFHPPAETKGSLEALAAHWTRGGEVDWQGLYPQPRRRLRLPTYPFARETYHIKASFSGVGTAPAPTIPSQFTQRLDADAFYLRDHRVRGTCVLPGAMGLELARAAFADGRTFSPVSITRVVWQRPLQLARGSIDISVPLAPAQDGEQDFRLLSDSSPHMQGRIAALDAGIKERMDLDALRRRCPKTLAPDWLYATFAGLGLDYGPAFQTVESLHAGDGEVLARLRLPMAARSQSFGLHPSMVDGAFQAALGLFHEGDDKQTALPFALDSLKALAPTSDTMWAHVRQVGKAGGILRLNIDMADDKGDIIVGVQGFALRLLKGEAPKFESKPAAIRHLAALVAKEAAISVDEVEAEAPLENYGIDSIMIVRLTEELERDFGPLPKTLFFEYRTLSALADYFLTTHPAALTQVLGINPGQSAARERPLTKMPEPTQPLAANTPIAIIGMAGRYPGAKDLDQFWLNLESGRDCVSEIPPDRWDHSKFFDPKPGTPGKTNSKWGGFLEGVDRFDPLFFNISPREAEYMDPQERLFLQCAWETIEDAGYRRADIAPLAPPLDGGNVGVFVGLMYQEYQLYGAERTQAGQPMALGGSAASIANRVSYFCGFHGPSLTVDSMCSSSLTAIHLACQSLREGDCRVALAGGVNLTLHPNKYLNLAQGRFMSSNGRCESFGKGGDGYVPGEGVGAVLLKPLDRAIADGDRILGIIRSSALNHGGKTNGYTVPNPAAQAAVIGKALDAAGVNPGMVSYVEAHGTGTSLGDPIEIAALARAYGERGCGPGFCAIGSVKSNIGHCESAAGMAGLTKVLLQFKHRKLAPSLHAETLNPGIDFAATPFAVQRHLSDWKPPSGATRIAGLSSFGAGGANAHLILEEYPAPAKATAPARPDIFPLSARDPDRLADMIHRLLDALGRLSEDDLPSVAYVLQEGREAFEERLAIVTNGLDELKSALKRALAEDFSAPGLHRGRAGRAKDRLQSAPRDLDSLAAAWVGGTKIDWTALHVGLPPAPRIALPTYPFAQERYWVPGSKGEIPSSLPLPLLFAPRWKIRPAQREVETLPERRLVLLCDPPQHLARQIAKSADGVEVDVLNAADTTVAGRYQSHALGLLDRLQRLFKERPQSALVQLVAPNDEDGSLLEGLAGMLRTARLERQGLRCQMVVLDYADPKAADFLAADRETLDNDIRHLDGGRLVRHWQELSAEQAAPSPWKDGGVYLITGGAGGVGLHLCEFIAGQAQQTTLWLIGRKPLPADAKRRLDALNARVEYRQADLSDRASIEDVTAAIRRDAGRLNGVLHAAGQTRDMLLVRKSATDLNAVLAPKVAGTMNLDAATADFDLDFMLLFASATGALGNSGQADYAAANAFLDAFAERRDKMAALGKRKGRTLSIDWPYWEDGGMRLDATVVAAMERLAGARPLKTASAMAALEAALAQKGETQILVLEGDHDRLRKILGPAPAERESSAPAPKAIHNNVSALVAACFSEVLRIPAERLDSDATLDRFGVDSVSALEIVAALENHFGPLPQTMLFEYPSISLLSAELEKTHGPARDLAPAQTPDTTSDIAIIAVAGRYPGAETIEEFWNILSEGRDCVGEVPPERWDPHYSPVKGKPESSHCKWGGFISGVDCFDADFFGYTPRMAALADPQERLFLENTWHLLERAGYTRAMLRQRHGGKVGVFVGAMFHAYGTQNADPDSQSLLALNSYASIANHVSFFFDLMGPSVAVDSMCSSGLQAVHQACQSLRFGECELAIAGGVNLSLQSSKYMGLSRAGLVGSHAGSRAFADGDGYLPAEGVGAVLLKPLAQAQRDGDEVLAVIKGSFANHGGHSAGFGVPSAEAQASLIEGNLRRTGIDARTISYVEAAASGAKLGDAIEIRALTRAFRAFTQESGFCAIGSVKTNMGHAEAASGLAQLTKVLLQLQHGRLAPSLKPDRANPSIVFDGSPFRPVWQAGDWHRPVIDGKEQPRRATVSSFGAGGSNVHVILEEAPAAAHAARQPDERRLPRRFPIFARTPEQLTQRLRQLADFVRETPQLSLARLSYTLCHCREPMDSVAQIVAESRSELADKLTRADEFTFEEIDAPDEESGPPLVLPPYPFARQRHWIGNAPPAQTSRTGPVPLGLILETLSQELGRPLDAADADRSFRVLGVDSMTALRLGYVIEERTGRNLTQLQIEDYPTPRRLAAFLGENAPVGPTLPVTNQSMPRRDLRQIPMTEGQKGLWVLQSLYPKLGTYNVPMAFRLSGIDHRALNRACKWLLEAYPILSTRVLAEGETPALQAVKTASPLHRVKVPKGMDPLDFARRQALRPFDMKSDALCRFELLHGKALGDGHEIFLMTTHHMVFDGASAWIASQALWDAYGRFAAGQEELPLPMTADFADFALWERDFMASARGRREMAFWQERLSGELPVTELPTDRVAPPGNAIDGQSLEASIGPESLAAAKRTATEFGMTLASFFLGVLVILLYRHTGQQDMLVGVPTLRRPESRFKNSVGYFVNMLAIRSRVPKGISARDLLQGLNRQLMEALDHGNYPFAAVARGLDGSLRGEPPYQISYAYQNFPMAGQSALCGEAGQAIFIPEIRQPGDGPFGIELYEEKEGLRLVAGYDGARFDAASIQRLLDRFARLADAICDAPEAAVSDIDMLSPDERRNLLKKWSKASPLKPRKKSIPELIAAQAKARPEAIAVTADGIDLSYRRLFRRANRLARHLRDRGVEKGDAVAVLLGRNSDSIVALLAILSAGAVWVPLDGEAPDRRLSAMLSDSSAKIVVTNGALSKRAGNIVSAVKAIVDLDRDADAIARHSAKKLKSAPANTSPAYIIYTSGSTGTPKGVVIAHQAIRDHCQSVIRHYRLNAKDVVLQFAPHVVDTALEQILPTLIAGGRLVMRSGPAWPPDALRNILTEQGVTVADLPPAYLREVLLAWKDVPDSACSCLRLCIVGGETLSPETARLWHESPLRSVRLLNAYGPTEATITCLTHEVEMPSGDGAIPVGRPLPGIEAYILDRDGNLVPEGVIGELHIGGNRLALGYHRQPDLTQEKFIEPLGAEPAARLYRTGDLASFLPGQKGTIAFHGRVDQQIKIRGFRVELGEIKAALDAFGLRDCAVTPRQGNSDGQALVAYVVPWSDDFDETALRAHMAARLPGHMLPAVYMRLDALPVTPSGKLDVAALPEPGLTKPTGDRPRTVLEEQLQQAWARVLGLDADRIGIHDDFQRLGGHSLLWVRLLAEIGRDQRLQLSAGDFLAAQTIAEQAQRLHPLLLGGASDSKPSSERVLVPLRIPTETGTGKRGQPPFFLVHAIAGTVSCYVDLARRLEQTIPVYGLQLPGADDPTSPPPDLSLPEMAALYIGALRTVQEQGPFRLGGWSMGGVLAFEMARQLRLSGDEIALLCLIDSYPPDLLRQIDKGAADASEDELLQLFYRDVLGLAEAQRPTTLAEAATTMLRGNSPGGRCSFEDADRLNLLFERFKANNRALMAYRPAACDAPLTLLRAASHPLLDKSCGWGGLARGGIALGEIPGDHYSILHPPSLNDCAAWIDEALAKCRNP